MEIEWKSKPGSCVFASLLMAGITKLEKNGMITLRNHAPQPYMAWLPV